MEGGKKKILNFLTTFNGWKGPCCRLKAQVAQIQTRPWPFKNCLPWLETSSSIDKDDFWSIVKLVANTQQPWWTARCSRGPLLFRRGWRSAESHQCRIDQRSWKMPVFYGPHAPQGCGPGLQRAPPPPGCMLQSEPSYQQKWHHFAQLSCFCSFL